MDCNLGFRSYLVISLSIVVAFRNNRRRYSRKFVVVFVDRVFVVDNLGIVCLKVDCW